MNLNPDRDHEFWNYSFHEMGLVDLPSMIEFIKSTTGVDKITYIGHSQGTTQMFAGMSYYPDYFQSVLNGFVALGPVTSLKRINSSFARFAAERLIDKISSLFKSQEILHNSASADKFQDFVCNHMTVLCKSFFGRVSELNPDDNNLERMAVFVGHFPSGSSVKSLQHFAYLTKTGDFADPEFKPYPLEKVEDIPIGLFVGDNDRLATPEDNRKLGEILHANKCLKFYKEYDNMGHLTFFLNKDNEYIDDVLEFIEDLE
jgi:lysosomal acid lipase/cholesteryl ester hydrolase